MKRRFKAIPGKGIVASTGVPKKRITASYFDYEVSAEDPADWYIDYDEFFETIEECIRELGLEIVDVDDSSIMVGESRNYELSNGAVLDSYDLEIDILYAHADNGLRREDQMDYIKNYIKKLS